MDYFNALLPLVALIAGFLLNELHNHLKAKRENREALGRALYVLLDIHTDAFYDQQPMPELFMDMLGIPEEMRGRHRNKFKGVMPTPEQQAEQIREALRLLAGSRPMLAFDLAGYEAIPLLLDRLEELSNEEPALKEKLDQAPKELKGERVRFERLILEVAKAHGKKTYEQAVLELRDKRD